MTHPPPTAAAAARGRRGVVDEATAAADEEAAQTAFALVDPRTPRRSGRLAAGLRAVVVPAGGFDIVDDVTYASVVDARTGFATETLRNAETIILDIYETHIQDRFDTL